MAKTAREIAGILAERLAGAAEVVEDPRVAALKVAADRLVEVALELRDNPDYAFAMLVDLTAVDYEDRFTVVCHLMRLTDAEVLKLLVDLPKEAPRVPSLTAVWPSANVQEREAYDMLGIVFTGHPDLRRILLDDDFEGHPLRKDYELPSQR